MRLREGVLLAPAWSRRGRSRGKTSAMSFGVRFQFTAIYSFAKQSLYLKIKEHNRRVRKIEQFGRCSLILRDGPKVTKLGP